MSEARLEQTEHGLAPAEAGWFVMNVREAAWETSEDFGEGCIFESEAAPFAQIGFDLHVLRPGQANGLYHREEDQEDFLVLAGECLLLIEGEERPLRAGDFVHCAPGADHIFIGAGERPCVIFMVGARQHPGRIVYPRSELALRRGAGVEEETPDARQAYAKFSGWRPTSAPDDLPFD
jgi:uncharacterized cupin superfamily protein